MKELIKWNFASRLETYKSMAGIIGRMAALSLSGKQQRPAGPDQRKWWQRSGFCVQYQIEKRPDLGWDRDYVEFNRSLMDEQGNLKFSGPYSRVDDCVALSKRIGVDYQSFQIKWHDGICWFNTELTRWKTGADYAGIFADLSRKEHIPFLYYYSSIFDHNPQFDSIQPNPHITPSFLGLLPPAKYRVYADYMRGHYDEIIRQYRPDGMWIDWWWADKTTRDTVAHFKSKHPGVVLAFNLSSIFFSSHNQQHYSSGEAHTLDGPFTQTREEAGGIMPVFVSTQKWANLFRMVFKHPWEIITPTSVWWQDMSLRKDINEFVRQAAVVMACGGKFSAGTSALMDGSLYPDHVRQLETLGQWYIPRRELFRGAYPARYLGWGAPGVSVDKPDFKSIASFYREGVLLHIINMKGTSMPIQITLKGNRWAGAQSAHLEPGGRQVDIMASPLGRTVSLAKEDVDPIDTIIYLPGIDRF